MPSESLQPLLSAHHFRLTVQQVTEYAMFLLDPAGIVTTWNLGAERIMGYEADEIIGQHLGRLYTHEDVRGSKPETALRAAAERGRFECEGWRLRHGGSAFWASVAITARTTSCSVSWASPR